jgi:DNA-directed RNA polymerase subunit RPC12/RpoP
MILDEPKHSYPCVICGAELFETKTTAACSFCGQETPAEYLCPNGHHICDDCQLADPLQVIERVCAGTKETDPGKIANLIMKHPVMIMHGPYHHALVAPAVLAALNNKGQQVLKPGRLASAIKRTADIPFAVCGTRGECGAAVSVGALISILTGASYLKDQERSLALYATAEVLQTIAQAGGPRCCKQSVYLSLETAAAFLKRELELDLPLTIRCEFTRRNEECKQEQCQYYEP